MKRFSILFVLLSILLIGLLAVSTAAGSALGRPTPPPVWTVVSTAVTAVIPPSQTPTATLWDATEVPASTTLPLISPTPSLLPSATATIIECSGPCPTATP